MDQTEQKLIAMNKLIIQTIIVITIAATLGNTIGIFKGEKTILETMMFLVVGSITSIWLFYQYRREPASVKMKTQAFLGFLLMYVFTVLTSQRNIVFVYVIPIIYLFTMYHDVKFMVKIAKVVGVVNVIAIMKLVLVNGQVDSNSMMMYVVQFISVVVIGITSVLATKLTEYFNSESIRQLTDANEKQEVILDEVLEIGGLLDGHSKDIYSIVTELKDSSDQMHDVMESMSNGMETTSNSISSQIQLSDDIHGIIEVTSDQAKKMDDLSKQSIVKVKEGVTIVKELTKNTELMNDSGKQVSGAVGQLKNKTNEINRITETITSIAKRINILSLNASIESARAGEAGKSFAVVATEIGDLASQTTSSIAGITSIIFELQTMVESAFGSLQEFDTISRQQNQLIGSTDGIFTQVNENMNHVNSMVSDVAEKVEKILQANQKLIENIDIVTNESDKSKSSIESTTQATEKNLLQVEQAKQIADELLNASERLQAYI
ncbi:methyl-accepting chemotaxis protein I [Lachnospiraceae bacterium KM106-2]|nr:methyl-accepting chemotaxis protein I [Lachnospiraceae bacterium KM106-2]